MQELTKEQEQLLPIYQKKWSQKFHSLEFDEQKARSFVDFEYRLIGKQPPVKLILDSPLEVQFAINMLKHTKQLKLGSKLGSKLDSELYSKLYSKLDNELGSKLYSKLDNELGSKLYSKLYSELYSKLSRELGSKLDSELGRELGSKLGRKLEYFSQDWWGTTSWYGYLCFYDYVNHELFPEVKLSVFEEYLKHTTNIVYMVSFENIVFISKPPIFVNFNVENSLHCESDAALQFADGWKLYYVDGVNFPEGLFLKAFKSKTITSEEILSVSNAEQKAVLIKKYGFNSIVDCLKEKKLIDKQTKAFNNNSNHPVIYELFEADIGGITAKFLKVEWYEKGKLRQSVLGVPRAIKDALEAVAWTFMMSKEEYTKKLVQEA